MRVALVHDYLTQYGGAERVLEELSSMFPHAPIYTLVYDSKSCGHAFDNRDVRTSFLQRIPHSAALYRYFPLLMPLAVERLHLSDYDIVISSSASYGKGVITPPTTLHICYCHTPLRYAWSDYRKVVGASLYPSSVQQFIPFLLPYIRMWDRQSSQRADYLLCNSYFIARKIRKYYGRDASVIYPPLNFQNFSVAKPQNYFVLVGRMLPYKRFDIAIQAFNQLGLPLKVIGKGPEYRRLRAMARPNIEFLGLVSERTLSETLSHAQALIFPQEEDFGITALESMAAGRPVIAYGKGGILESAIEGTNCIFFHDQTPEALVVAVRKFFDMRLDPAAIRKSVERFDRVHFRESLHAFIDEKLKERRTRVLI